MASKLEIAKKRRQYVNAEFAKQTRGTSMSNPRKARLLKKLWREAKHAIN